MSERIKILENLLVELNEIRKNRLPLDSTNPLSKICEELSIADIEIEKIIKLEIKKEKLKL